jgi:hypothetical protein
MASQDPALTKKLQVFLGLVVGSLGIVLAANVAIRSRTSAFSEGAGTPRRAGLERLWANPTRCAMTMEPSPDNERPMRHVNAGIIGPVDVLELGQSDADHVSSTFFKEGVRFYNGFLSNSYFVYHYEVFDDLVAAHGPPKLVLYDVRSGYLLRDATEPAWDTPGNSPLWWGFPPFHTGKPAPLPWYRDIPSLLSLAQTELTLTWLKNQLPVHASGPVSTDTEKDDGKQFRCVDLTKKSSMYRWMADGSRIYQGELDGKLAPHGPIHVSEAVGDRHVNETRPVQLDWVLGKILERGTKVILYSPPIHPASYVDPRQIPAIKASGAALQRVADKYGIDYCDLTLLADDLGCTNEDFSDELHVSRRCDRLVMKRLATSCAPKAGPMLRGMLAPATLE